MIDFMIYFMCLYLLKHYFNERFTKSLVLKLMVATTRSNQDHTSVGVSCQKHPGPSVQELKKVVCPLQKLSAHIFLAFLQLLELCS